MPFRPFDRPKDAFYEGNTGKLGLLGADLVRDVVFVYGNIGGFRVGLGQIQTHGADMGANEFRIRVRATIGSLDRAVELGMPLLQALTARTEAKFWATLLQPRSSVALAWLSTHATLLGRLGAQMNLRASLQLATALCATRSSWG